jgi:hypothetical protein
MRDNYLPKRRLKELKDILSQRDKAVLYSVQKCRYLTTDQIMRLHFTDYAKQSVALRSTQYALVKLRDYRLIKSLERRIGGVRAGSNSYAWALSETGAKFMSITGDNADDTPRKRSFEPSPTFLRHTLAVSEIYVQLTEICRRHGLELVRAALEPECWRDYAGENGKPVTLKPDMFAVTSDGVYEYLFFIEVDMDTEAPSVVLTKCSRYTLYCKRVMEQRPQDMFPLVVWIVPSAARRDNLKQRIYECQKLPYKNLFVLITPEEFKTLIVNGAEALNENNMEGAA